MFSPFTNPTSRKTSNRARLQLDTLEDKRTPAVINVASVQFGDGSANRSDVMQVIIRLDQPVEFEGDLGIGGANDAITLSRREYAGDDIRKEFVTMSVKQIEADVIVLSDFSGEFAEADGSLTNGYWDLYMGANGVAADGSAKIDGLYDSADSGNDYFAIGELGKTGVKNNFFRLEGDSNGDGAVNRIDFNSMRNAFGTTNSTWDFNNDGAVDQDDFLAFLQLSRRTIN